MTSPIALPAGEHGRLRVFALSMTAEAAETLDPAQALGATPTDPSRVEVFPVSNLEGLGLAGYLVEGCGIPEASVAPDRSRLDALDGHVMVLFSRAYETAVTLTPAPELTLIGTYDEARPEAHAAPVESDSAKAWTGTPKPSPRKARATARRAGLIFFGLIVLLLIVILILVFR